MSNTNPAFRPKAGKSRGNTLLRVVRSAVDAARWGGHVVAHKRITALVVNAAYSGIVVDRALLELVQHIHQRFTQVDIFNANLGVVPAFSIAVVKQEPAQRICE